MGVTTAIVAGTLTEQVAAADEVACVGDERPVAGHVPSVNSLESRAAAWDEAERAKFMARWELSFFVYKYFLLFCASSSDFMVFFTSAIY